LKVARLHRESELSAACDRIVTRLSQRAYIQCATQTHDKQYVLYATGCNWKNMVVETECVLPARANRIEKSDADFALFVHVARCMG